MLLTHLTVFHGVLQSLAGFEASGPASVLGVVMNEHVVRDSEDGAVHTDRAREDHL